MPTLKEPQKSIPGGFQFFVPQTNWKPAPFSSIDSIVQQLIQHRRGRPDLVAKHGWSLDLAQVTAEVTAYQVAVCVQNGWNDYLLGGSEGAVPFQPPTRHSLLSKVRSVAGGAEILVNWMQEGQPTVSQEVANKRAFVCAELQREGRKDENGNPIPGCPKNGKGGLEAYFTVPVSNAIRHELERKREMKLETPSDESLNVCTACSCPLKLKVWVPLPNILPNLTAEQKVALDSSCWIVNEK